MCWTEQNEDINSFIDNKPSRAKLGVVRLKTPDWRRQDRSRPNSGKEHREPCNQDVDRRQTKQINIGYGPLLTEPIWICAR